MEHRILIYILFFLLSLSLGYIFSILMIELSFKLKILDIPNEKRKIHSLPTPLLGGVGIYLSFLISVILFFVFNHFFDFEIVINYSQIIGVLIAGLIIIVGGIMDDKYNLSPIKQILFVLLACFVIIIFGTQIKFITRPGGGILDLTIGEFQLFGMNFYILGIIITFLWLLITTNATKLLDGLDGLCSGITSIGLIMLFIVSLFWDKSNSFTPNIILIFLGAVIGFLILNFNPAKIFLGNGGSNLLGIMIGFFAVATGAKIATALLVMGLPLLDMILVIIQRLKNHEHPFTHADRKHLHFKLIDYGFSVKRAVFFMYLASFTFGVIALFQDTIGKITMLFVLLIFFSLIFYKLSKHEKANNN
ncbi:MAG TPA: MraY family glycosyltransferase [bacterium]|nr:MraY family glycosyltransferase [bacterium]